MQTLTQIYGAQHTAAFCAIPFHHRERTPSLSILHFQRGGRGKRMHWKPGVRWHRPICQLYHRARRGTPWWLAEGRIAEPLYESLVAAGGRHWSVSSVVVEQSINDSQQKHVSRRTDHRSDRVVNLSFKKNNRLKMTSYTSSCTLISLLLCEKIIFSFFFKQNLPSRIVNALCW